MKSAICLCKNPLFINKLIFSTSAPRRQVFQIKIRSLLPADSGDAEKSWYFLLLFKLFEFEGRGACAKPRTAYTLDRALGTPVNYMPEIFL